MGNQVFTSFGMGTVLVVAIALVGSLTVLPAVLSQARRPRRPRADPGSAEAARQARRVPVLGADRRRGPAPAGPLGRRRRRAARRARDPRVQPAHRQRGHAGTPAQPPGDEGLPARPAGVPGRGRARDGRDQRARRHLAAGHRGDRRAGARGRSRPAEMYQPITVDVSASHQAARVSIPLVGTGTDAASLDALALLRNTRHPGDDRPRARRHRAHHRRGRSDRRLQRHDEVPRPIRVRRSCSDSRSCCCS